ncbi:unnamed protein product [Mucor hiemalis]
MSSNRFVDNDLMMTMQERLIELELKLARLNTSTSEKPPVSPHFKTNNTTDKKKNAALHSLRVQPSYTWSPSSTLSKTLALDSPLYSTPLAEKERHKKIDRYPKVDQIQYQPPDTVPTAHRKMSKEQTNQDMALKRLQYRLSEVFRPLDVLGLELSQDTRNENTDRYLTMLKDCRSLLLDVCAQTNNMRTNVAFQAIDPSFSANPVVKETSNKTYTMSPAEFQAAIDKQSTAHQTHEVASNPSKKKRSSNRTQQNES